MKAEIVIGSLFGDEGKGITTDYLCSRYLNAGSRKIVVRFSGGQQAGHNVKIGNVSHVHSNYGSGALRGVPSYFSEHCTMYPVTFYNESKILLPKVRAKSYFPDPIVFYHPLVMVTTPADVVYNRITEKRLGHGSCGLGVAATMKRNIETGYKLYFVDFFNKRVFEQKISAITQYYINMIYDDKELLGEFLSLIDGEMEDFNEAINKIKFKFYVKPYEFLKDYSTLIFEGSQGIMLDKDHGFFPNVTYANTTSKNAIEICNKLGIKNIEIFYVTRCYQTRHGAGWMSNEDPIKIINSDDEINKFNPWQKNFRIGEIDYDLLNHAFRIDEIYSGDWPKNLVITCLDQRPGFEFDYDALDIKFAGIYKSSSPQSANMLFMV